MMNKRAF